MNFKRAITILPFLLFACDSYPETPEEVIRQYNEDLYGGRCEEAKKYCDEEAQTLVQGAIDAGCRTAEVVIDSVKCDVNGDTAKCICYEEFEGMHISFPHILYRNDGKWKLTLTYKDAFANDTLSFQ